MVVAVVITRVGAGVVQVEQAVVDMVQVMGLMRALVILIQVAVVAVLEILETVMASPVAQAL